MLVRCSAHQFSVYKRAGPGIYGDCNNHNILDTLLIVANIHELRDSD